MSTKQNSQNGHTRVKTSNTAIVFADDVRVKSSKHPRPYRLNPETEEQREKRLAKRKTMTLKAFQAAYETNKKD